MEVLLLVTALVAVLTGVVPVLVFASRRPGYSQVRQTVSELGEAGARDEKKVALFAFAPAGHAIWVYIAVLAFTVPELAGGSGLWLFAMLGVVYIAAAIFPCDPGGPFIGSWRNNVHNVVAATGYLCAAAGLIELGHAMEDIRELQSISTLSRAGGWSAAFGMFLLLLPLPFRGLVQRALEAIFYAWILLVAIVVTL